MPIEWTLAEIMAEKGLTVAGLSERTGLTKQTLHKLVRDPAAPRIDGATLDKLCTALNVKPGRLLRRVRRSDD